MMWHCISQKFLGKTNKMLMIKLKGNPETEINPKYKGVGWGDCRPSKLTKFDIFPH